MTKTSDRALAPAKAGDPTVYIQQELEVGRQPRRSIRVVFPGELVGASRGHVQLTDDATTTGRVFLELEIRTPGVDETFIQVPIAAADFRELAAMFAVTLRRGEEIGILKVPN